MTIQHNPVPSRAAINHAEIQLFDNREDGPQHGKPGFRLKISTLQCPLDQIERTHAQTNYCALMIPREFRKGLTRRVSRGTMTQESADLFRAYSCTLSANTLIGLVENLPSGSEQMCSAVIIDNEVTTVTLYLDDGEMILSCGEERREGSDANAPIWRTHYDPHNWYAAHRAKVTAALRRKKAVENGEATVSAKMLGVVVARLKAVEDRLDEAESAGRAASMLINELSQRLAERDAENSRLYGVTCDHAARIVELEGRSDQIAATNPITVDADRPLSVAEKIARNQKWAAQVMAERKAAGELAALELAENRAAIAEGRA
ncbi:hypothetical protein ACFOD4_04535 [Pseudoroseomonas globiformis]|uniref:Uncharacterized protein n=1 Tax=Teichococcus globiformis TaxID=2307229 RepID=A0ABV7FVB8_9PROT